MTVHSDAIERRQRPRPNRNGLAQHVYDYGCRHFGHRPDGVILRFDDVSGATPDAYRLTPSCPPKSNGPMSQRINATDEPIRVGKRRAGRNLDGQLHDEYPSAGARAEK